MPVTFKQKINLPEIISPSEIHYLFMETIQISRCGLIRLFLTTAYGLIHLAYAGTITTRIENIHMVVKESPRMFNKTKLNVQGDPKSEPLLTWIFLVSS